MPTRNARFAPAALIALLALLAALPARAADHFLTVGGGSSASNNQVSLEKNVLYLQRFLAERGLADAPHEILFADGTGGARDLVYTDPNAQRPRVNELLGDILGADNGLYDDYRAHDIPHLWGPSNRASLNKWFDTIGTKLAAGDRLFVYFTGHGGKGSTLSMWNENDMPAKEFAGLLDRLPPKVSVVIVMVQCFSGGFADMIFTGGDPGKGLAKQDRCGFFATVSDRFAAGCTSDVDEENYREYSTYFWAALYGQTRMGQPVPPPDFDGDGKTSLAEAHGYVLINSDTIDISVKTSDALLRKYSKMKPAAGPTTKPKPTTAATPTSPATAPAAAPLIDAEGSLADLIKVAGPVERAVLDGLARQLDLKPDAPVKAARTLASDLQKKQRDLDRDAGPARRRRNDARRAIRSALMMRWPELSNLLHPRTAAVLRDEADAVVKMIESAPQYAEFEKASADVDKAEAEKMTLDRKWVKTQRFIRQAEHVALAANLPAVAPPDVVAKYKAITAAEAGLLGNSLAGRAAASGGVDGIARLNLPGLEQKRVDGVGCDPLPAQE